MQRVFRHHATDRPWFQYNVLFVKVMKGLVHFVAARKCPMVKAQNYLRGIRSSS